MPQVGHATCCNFGCWHCWHVAVDAGVAFQELRRWRVRERDIFRLGSGTIVSFKNSYLNLFFQGRQYPPAPGALSNRLPVRQTFPARIYALVAMVLGKCGPLLPAPGAKSFTFTIA